MKSGFLNLLKIATGILLMILNIGIWINGGLIHTERGMDTILAFPLLVAGASLLFGWYKSAGAVPATKPQRWKFILSVLLINYAVLYLIYMISDIIYRDAIDFLSIPGIILPVLLGLFIMGFILSWEYEFYAGIFFLLWYFLVLYGSFQYVEIMSRGPHMQFGIVIFLHGILYLFYYFRIKQKK
jgi:hypothetical protein